MQLGLEFIYLGLILKRYNTMNSFVDSRKINAYSLALSEKIIIEAYTNKSALNGQDIKSLTSVEQVNILIIKNLFDKWQEEAQQLRSPYFDYQCQDVKNALKAFLNTLSNHISIHREHFKPLLSKAILDTILIALAPKEFFIQEAITRKEQFEEFYNGLKRFMRINKSTIESIDQIVSNAGKDWEKMLNQISELEVETPDAEKTIQDLSLLLRIELNEIILQPVNIQAPSIIQEEEEEEVKESLSTPVEAQPSIETAKPVKATDAPSAITSINDLFQKNEKTLNDKLKSIPEEPNPYTGPRIQDLRKAISLNEKYLYIKELFESNAAEFTQVIETLETFNSLAEAQEFIQNKFKDFPSWTEENPYYKEFLSLLNRRY